MARSIMLPQGITDLVRVTGQPQTITAVEFENNIPVATSQHVVFLDEETVRSAPIADWPAAQAELATKEQQKQETITTRQGLIAAAQAAVGKLFKDLDAATRWALFALVLWKLGALNRDGSIKELREWL